VQTEMFHTRAVHLDLASDGSYTGHALRPPLHTALHNKVGKPRWLSEHCCGSASLTRPDEAPPPAALHSRAETLLTILQYQITTCAKQERTKL
jgi:hypothetical protein